MIQDVQFNAFSRQKYSVFTTYKSYVENQCQSKISTIRTQVMKMFHENEESFDKSMIIEMRILFLTTTTN